MSSIPQTTKAIVVQKGVDTSGETYHGAVLESRPLSKLKEGEIMVKMGAVAFNHRDVWIRKGLYPNIGFGSVFGADGAGIVIASSDPSDTLLQKRVFLSPQQGWISDPDAPESPTFGVIGGVKFPVIGTFAEYVVVARDQVILSPEHLDDVHVAAWPLAGVTAWRATMINGQISTGQNVLITGIGGGVALVALQLCLGKGANVFVTSGNPEKIEMAKKLGAKGGVSYKDPKWGKNLQNLLKETSASGLLDVVIDSGGGDIMGIVGNFLKQGGRVVCYGMHANPQVTFTMRHVMRNQKLLGSTMGSITDLRAATEFIAAHKIVPVVSDIVEGLENAEEGFEKLKGGEQFGKVVIRIGYAANKPRL
ncbi:zinc-containing alcohol dehydrogenase superfamily protein [Moniliophthora roreri MCA 2997]|uniref:Zinc-containing alcohol dehydrogenase superfamily protein n=2 Tax=Moniliophthora roreri TaxID=221103 RepID=V2YGM5_MONRO|nr:zinc-containing alcohol dehydrogenase superfamily protein [Moniliophthora roreri MCA 2997]